MALHPQSLDPDSQRRHDMPDEPSLSDEVIQAITKIADLKRVLSEVLSSNEVQMILSEIWGCVWVRKTTV